MFHCQTVLNLRTINVIITTHHGKEVSLKLSGYYSSGEFAKKAHVSVRTIRFYDKQNILKPSFVNENGARFYTDEDFARLQQVILLKFLGFSLEDIRNLTIGSCDSQILLNSLHIQLKLIQDKIEQMQLVEKAIRDTSVAISENNSVDWSRMLELINLTNMENSLKSQYQNANNISARISLHELYSTNKEGWFPWIFKNLNLTNNMKILEIGCGNGSLWIKNADKIPADCEIILSDISVGMLRDTRRDLSKINRNFLYNSFNCENIPYGDNSFDLVIANHVLFYCDNIDRACSEIRRVLKPDGRFVCSTYGARHMQEISSLVSEFDSRIVLSADKLYEKFGLENGADILSKHFKKTEKLLYDDKLLVDKPEPVIEYILSCHGNQNQFLLDRYKLFRDFIAAKTKKALTITKNAGIFICTKQP